MSREHTAGGAGRRVRRGQAPGARRDRHGRRRRGRPRCRTAQAAVVAATGFAAGAATSRSAASGPGCARAARAGCDARARDANDLAAPCGRRRPTGTRSTYVVNVRVRLAIERARDTTRDAGRGRSADGRLHAAPRTAWTGSRGRRGEVVHRLIHIAGAPVVVRAAQLPAGRVLFGGQAARGAGADGGSTDAQDARCRSRPARRFTSGSGSDPLIGPSRPAEPATASIWARPDPFEALSLAVCEQLIEYERAATIQRRLIRGSDDMTRSAACVKPGGGDGRGSGAGAVGVVRPDRRAVRWPPSGRRVRSHGTRRPRLRRCRRAGARWRRLQSIPGSAAGRSRCSAFTGAGSTGSAAGRRSLLPQARGATDAWRSARRAGPPGDRIRGRRAIRAVRALGRVGRAARAGLARCRAGRRRGAAAGRLRHSARG